MSPSFSIGYAAWAYEIAKRLRGIDRHAREQLLRNSQSIPVNIAEGNGRRTSADRRRFFDIARGSALECGSIQDCLEACHVLTAAENAQAKTMLIRIVSMLPKLGSRSHDVREKTEYYDGNDNDNDHDNEHGRTAFSNGLDI